MPSWHRQYRGKSIGRILHFLYHYCGFDVAEKATIGQCEVHYNGNKIATYAFLSDTDIPHFTFLTPDKSYTYRDPNAMREMWETNQKEKVFEAIKDAEDAKPEPCKECRSLRLKAEMWEDFYRQQVSGQKKVDG